MKYKNGVAQEKDMSVKMSLQGFTKGKGFPNVF